MIGGQFNSKRASFNIEMFHFGTYWPSMINSRYFGSFISSLAWESNFFSDGSVPISADYTPVNTGISKDFSDFLYQFRVSFPYLLRRRGHDSQRKGRSSAALAPFSGLFAYQTSIHCHHSAVL